MRARLVLCHAITLVLASMLTLGASPAHAQRVKPDYFGMHAFDWITQAPKVPYGSANFTTTGTYWFLLQPDGSASPDFSRLDAQIDAVTVKGHKPLVILGGTPSWAVDATKIREGDHHTRTQMPRRAAWKSYVRTVAQRYGNRIDYQVWPEPNVKYNFVGTPQEMGLLTMDASKIVRSLAPRSKIVPGPAVTRFPMTTKWFHQYLATKPGGKPLASWVDVISVNPYAWPTRGPEATYGQIKKTKKVMKKLKIRKPLWVGEINYGITLDRSNAPEFSAQKGAAFVSRTHLLHAAADVQRVYWLGWFRYRLLGINLMGADGEPTLAGKAYAVTRTWMVNNDMRGCKAKKGLYTCTMKTPRAMHRIYWKTWGQHTIKTPETTRYTQTATGKKNTRRGSYKVKISTLPILVHSSR